MARQLARTERGRHEPASRSPRRRISRRRARWPSRSARSRARRRSAGSPAWASATSTGAGGGEVRDEAADPHLRGYFRHPPQVQAAEVARRGDEGGRGGGAARARLLRGRRVLAGGRLAIRLRLHVRRPRGLRRRRRAHDQHPDTVGYAIPREWGERIARIQERLKRHAGNYVLSVHCHNDLGQAVAQLAHGP